jgi:outer membrane protein assembly factor BamD (BamD/ComL family)
MIASGINASGFPDYATQDNSQKTKQDFQQLGKDLQAGNLTAAESDFVTLQQDLPQGSVASASQINAAAASSTQSGDPIAQAFTQLASDLQAGNLTAAQKDYSALQQDFQTAAAQGSQAAQVPHGHHHHGDSDGTKGSGSSAIGQLVTELGQELKSGNLSAAQQTYQSLQQEMKQFSPGGAEQTSSSPTSGSSSVSVNA